MDLAFDEIWISLACQSLSKVVNYEMGWETAPSSGYVPDIQTSLIA
jgi:hypothetical protein